MKVAKLNGSLKAIQDYGFERDKSLDFTDDGNKFIGFMWRGKVPLTQCYSDGELYLSIRDDYLYHKFNLPYLFWREYKDSSLRDEYNGTSKEVDLEHLSDNCERIWDALQKAKIDFENTAYPDLSKRIEAYKESTKEAEDLLHRNLNWFEMNLSESGIKEAYGLYSSLKSYYSRDLAELENMINKQLPKERAFEVAQYKDANGSCSYYVKKLNELIDQKSYSFYYQTKSESMR